MKSVSVHFNVLVPDDVSESEITEWVEFEVGATCSLKGTNPLSDKDLEAVRNSVWVDV